LLIVEIASPTTRDLDGTASSGAYAQAHVGWYWIIERDTITVFENEDGQFVERRD